ncbi:MAG: ATP-grasp domain-containing protein [Paramuribaculum sp.]|nr:ATP-grasp domain-containing protein [Paramuribaculum sp.]
MNILFTCAGRRTYLLKYFKEQLGDNGMVIGADMQLSAPALTAADIKEQVPAVYADNYIDSVLDICKRYMVNAIICLNDLELPILAANIERFKSIGVMPIISRPEVIDICFDKYRTAQYIENIGLKTPKTFISLTEAKTAIESGNLRFPLVLKPRWGSGSIGIEFINNVDELDEIYTMLLNKVKKSILATASTGEEYILIQQKIEGQEYGLDVMNDLIGNNRGVSVKKKLAMRAGETDKAQTVYNEQIQEIGQILGENLHHIGNLDVDIFEKDGEYYVLELNPRFGGGFPFSYEAGVNFPKAIIEWLKGNEISSDLLRPTYGLTFAKCDYLVNVN